MCTQDDELTSPTVPTLTSFSVHGSTDALDNILLEPRPESRLSRSDVSFPSFSNMDNLLEGDMDIQSLKTKISKETLYSFDQLEILQQQKRNVQTAIATAEFKDHNLDSSIPQPARSFTLDHGGFWVTEKSGKKWPIPCRFKCCHRCRPSYMDRAWEHLDEVLSGSFKESNAWEAQCGPPLSNARLVQTLGTRPEPKRFMQDFDLYASDSSEDGAMEDVASRVGRFRAGLTKAFKNMVTSPQRDLVQECQPLHKQLPPLPEESTDNLDIAKWKRFNEETLAEASVVPLPGRDGEDELEGFGRDAILVGGGFAMTEEALEEMAPNIITQA